MRPVTLTLDLTLDLALTLTLTPGEWQFRANDPEDFERAPFAWDAAAAQVRVRVRVRG